MIVICPGCETRFRVDRNKWFGKRLSVRCVHCQKQFQLELPDSQSGQDRNRVSVMIAHSDHELCNSILKIVEKAGFEGVVSHTGDDVLASVESIRPDVIIVDVALQGLYAFEIVESLRSRPGLEEIKIILLSSVYNKAAYKRAPTSLYGADDYIEKHHLPNDLAQRILQLVYVAERGSSKPRAMRPELKKDVVNKGVVKASPEEPADLLKVEIQAAEEHEISANDVSQQQRAERLARIIVSDISLYHQERIDEGILNGNWSELLAKEIKEARLLFAKRFPSPEIQNKKILEAAFLDLFEKRQKELGA